MQALLWNRYDCLQVVDQPSACSQRPSMQLEADSSQPPALEKWELGEGGDGQWRGPDWTVHYSVHVLFSRNATW
jgi:hypothetical protein